MKDSDKLAELERLCAEEGFRLEKVSSVSPAQAHYKIHGKQVVNYWPLSAKQTAHVKDAKESIKNVSPEEAVILAGE